MLSKIVVAARALRRRAYKAVRLFVCHGLGGLRNSRGVIVIVDFHGLVRRHLGGKVHLHRVVHDCCFTCTSPGSDQSRASVCCKRAVHGFWEASSEKGREDCEHLGKC